MRRCSASSGENPRSRKTFPVERVIFSLIARSPTSLPPVFQELAETLAGQLQVPFRSPLRLLLECVKNVDRLIELRDVEDAMLASRTDPNLANSETDRGHRLPIVRLNPTLNPPELKACHLSRVGWETAQILSGRPEPDRGLLRHASLYKYRHARSISRSPNRRLERPGDQPQQRMRAPVVAGRSAACR
jgi:hypothetical protein